MGRKKCHRSKKRETRRRLHTYVERNKDGFSATNVRPVLFQGREKGILCRRKKWLTKEQKSRVGQESFFLIDQIRFQRML
jgi:hypothetical protein